MISKDVHDWWMANYWGYEVTAHGRWVYRGPRCPRCECVVRHEEELCPECQAELEGRAPWQQWREIRDGLWGE